MERALRRCHHRNLLRAPLIAVVACVHTACFARVINATGSQNLQRKSHARAVALKAWPRLTPPQQRAAACGREQAPHRRVDEVAHAGHQHPRYERLGRQHEQAGAK
jgi:hypothetical protein